MSNYQKLMDSCLAFNKDPGIVAYISYDTCGKESPIRNCTPGEALYMGVMVSFLDIPITTESSQEMRNTLRQDLMYDVSNNSMTMEDEKKIQSSLMYRSMKTILKDFFHRLSSPDASREQKILVLKRGRQFLTDVMEGKVGTDPFRDKALDILKRVWGSGTSLTDTKGWDTVRFPIVFHLQWDTQLTPKGRPRMLFHTTFDPWKTAVGLAMSLCSPNPPIQVPFSITFPLFVTCF